MTGRRNGAQDWRRRSKWRLRWRRSKEEKEEKEEKSERRKKRRRRRGEGGKKQSQLRTASR